MASSFITMEQIVEAHPVLFSATLVSCMTLIFGTLLYHMITFGEEKTNFKARAAQKVDELESVESSQELRSKRERQEDQELEEEEEVEAEAEPYIPLTPAKRARIHLDDYDRRVHLVTFAATDEEAEFIMSYVPASRYLMNLHADELSDHVAVVEYKRRRHSSCPPA
jgi:hypothetical protein